jgi:hypothetical protein
VTTIEAPAFATPRQKLFVARTADWSVVVFDTTEMPGRTNDRTYQPGHHGQWSDQSQSHAKESQEMTAVAHPIVSTHHVIGVLVTTAIAVGLSVALTLAFATTTSSARNSQLGRSDTALCASFANATANSPAAFRLADQISARGSCR